LFFAGFLGGAIHRTVPAATLRWQYKTTPAQKKTRFSARMARTARSDITRYIDSLDGRPTFQPERVLLSDLTESKQIG